MQEAIQFFHFDPVTLVVLITGLIGGWYTVKTNSSWHTAWIEKHSAECDEFRKANNELFAQIRETNAKLTAIAESNIHRIDRLESKLDKL